MRAAGLEQKSQELAKGELGPSNPSSEVCGLSLSKLIDVLVPTQQ